MGITDYSTSVDRVEVDVIMAAAAARKQGPRRPQGAHPVWSLLIPSGMHSVSLWADGRRSTTRRFSRPCYPLDVCHMGPCPLAITPRPSQTKPASPGEGGAAAFAAVPKPYQGASTTVLTGANLTQPGSHASPSQEETRATSGCRKPLHLIRLLAWEPTTVDLSLVGFY